MVCNTGVGLTPKVEGRLLHLSPGGLYNGLILLVDDETRSYWDHITGEAVEGPLEGARMARWPVDVTTVEAALASDPELCLARSRPRVLSGERLMTKAWSKRVAKSVIFPPGFKRTMSPPDRRRPEMEVGLGVVIGETARFYPLEEVRRGVTDTVAGRLLELEVCETARLPIARWADQATGTETGVKRPFQLLTRWYGFSRTYPRCEVYGEGDGES